MKEVWEREKKSVNWERSQDASHFQYEVTHFHSTTNETMKSVHTRVQRGGLTRRVTRAGRARDKKFFVRVTECWLNACESDMNNKINAKRSLWYSKKVQSGAAMPTKMPYRAKNDVTLREGRTLHGLLSS